MDMIRRPKRLNISLANGIYVKQYLQGTSNQAKKIVRRAHTYIYYQLPHIDPILKEFKGRADGTITSTTFQLSGFTYHVMATY
jgi:hypothetical protein